MNVYIIETRTAVANTDYTYNIISITSTCYIMQAYITYLTMVETMDQH